MIEVFWFSMFSDIWLLIAKRGVFDEGQSLQAINSLKLVGWMS